MRAGGMYALDGMMTNARVEIALFRNIHNGLMAICGNRIEGRGHVNWITQILDSRLINSLLINSN